MHTILSSTSSKQYDGNVTGEFPPGKFPPVNCPPANGPLEDGPPVELPPEDFPLSGGACNLTEGQLSCPKIVFCYLLAMIFEGEIVHSDIHGRQIGSNSEKCEIMEFEIRREVIRCL